MLKPTDQFTRGRECAHQSQSRPVNIVVLGGVLLRKSDKQSAADVLNIEGSEAPRFSREETVVVALIVALALIATLIVTLANCHRLKVGVEYINMAVVKIGRVEPWVAVHGGDCNAFIHRADRRNHDLGLRSPVPSRDRSVLGCEQEASGRAS